MPTRKRTSGKPGRATATTKSRRKTAKKPAAKKPAVKKSVTKKPAAKRPAVKKKTPAKPTTLARAKTATKRKPLARKKKMKKTVFVAFSMKDKTQRDFLRGQSLHTRSPFEYIDMSVKEPYLSHEWKQKVRTRIKRSHGVIALISKNSLTSTGQEWEIECAREEGKKILGISAYRDDQTKYPGIRTYNWTWPNVTNFINGL